MAALVGLAVLASACTADTAGSGTTSRAPRSPHATATPSTTTAQVAAFTPGPFGAAQLDADVDALAGWGIGTYETPTSGAPLRPVTGAASPLRLLRSQVEQLGAGAAAGAGLTGGQLDAILRKATGVEVPMATLLAGYARSDAGLAPQLRAVERVVDTSSPAEAVFPSILLVAFVHDLAAASGRAQPSPAASFAHAGAPPHAAAANLCAAANAFFSDLLRKVFDGLKIDQLDTRDWAPVFKVLGNVVNAVTTVFNAMLSGAQFVVINGVQVALEPIRRTLGSVAMVVAIALQAATLIVPLDGIITLDDEAPAYGADGSPITYTATLRTSSRTPTEWPEIVTDCAKLVNVTLPDLALAGSPVEWKLTSGGATRTSAEEVLAKDGVQGVARLKFDTATEPQEWRDKGPEAAPVPALLKATVKRKTKVLKDALEAVLNEAFAFLPEFLRARVVGLASTQIDAALEQIVTFSDTTFSLPFEITHHGPPEPTPSPKPGKSTPPGGAMWVHVERPELPGARAGRIMDITSCSGLGGPWRGKLRNGGLHADKLEIPWTDLPMAPFRITNGAGDTRASGIVTIPFPEIRRVRTTYDLHVTVSGTRMTVTGVPPEAAPYFRNIPIEAAPAGRC